MKKIAFILAVMSVLLACEKDKNAPQFYAYFTKTNITSTYTELDISFHVQTNGTIQSLTAEYDSNEDFSTFQTKVMSLANDRWSVQLSDLKANTEYYLRYRFRSPMNVALADTVMKIKTPDYDKPVMGEVVFMDTTDTGISLRFSVESAGGIALKDVGVCYGTNILPTKENAKYVTATKVTLGYTAHLKDLSPNTKYYIRTYAINDKGTGYSAQKNITTLSLPQVQTDEAEDITTRSALCYGKLLSNGNTSASVGICYASSGEPSLENGKQVAAEANAEGRFSITLPDLQPGTEYAYRAYAQNKIGVGYGEIKKFKTVAPSAPTVVTMDASQVSYTSAFLMGKLDDDGGTDITEMGFVYGSMVEPTLEDGTKQTVTKLNNSIFSLSLTGLHDNSTYYYRAYATNSQGTSYGAVKSLTTKEYTAPVVRTDSIAQLTGSSVMIYGTITDYGGLDLLDHGICYSTHSNPTIDDSHGFSVSSQGKFHWSITSLSEKTTYYARAFAKNSLGTSYGNQISFKTPGAPTLSIHNTSATRTSYYYYAVSLDYTINADVDFEVTEVTVHAYINNYNGTNTKAYGFASSTNGSYTGHCGCGDFDCLCFQKTYDYSYINVEVTVQTNIGTVYGSTYISVKLQDY